MANCAGIDCGQRQGLREDAKLWSTSLKDLLASSDGRDTFREFLLGCELSNESAALGFWERCNEIVCEHQQLKKTSSSGRYNTTASSELILKATTVCEEYVETCEVNLDEEMGQRLNKCWKNNDPDEIALVFQEAKGWAHNLLKEIHSSFAEDLIKKYNLSSK